MPSRPASSHPPSLSRPHSLSLKVLRLSKPSLAPSTVLPAVEAHPALQKASLAYPTQPAHDVLPLAPLLTLPPSFGAAYVGETFSCTLCVNNEVQAQQRGGAADEGLHIREISVQAELQTPATSASGAQGVVLEVSHDAASDEAGQDGQPETLRAGRSWQGIVRHDLKEEGPHVLAVTIGYTEVHAGAGAATGETEHRKRQFRKLYQFVAQQAVGVRTKIGELKQRSGARADPAARTGRSFAVEAQIENLADQSVLLDTVSLELGRALACTSLNGDEDDRTLLAPGDVAQVAFRLDQVAAQGEDGGGGGGGGGELHVEAGRFVLAQLKVDWRMGMGQDGTLRTGWLGCLKRD